MSRENVELAWRNWELWTIGADDELFRQLAPDVERHHNVGLGTPLEGINRGRQEVVELSKAIRDSFGVSRVQIEDVRDLSSTEVLVLGSLHLRGRGRGSGAAVTTPFGAVTDIVNGLAVTPVSAHSGGTDENGGYHRHGGGGGGGEATPVGVAAAVSTTKRPSGSGNAPARCAQDPRAAPPGAQAPLG